MQDPGTSRQKSQARAERNFYQPCAVFLADLNNASSFPSILEKIPHKCGPSRSAKKANKICILFLCRPILCHVSLLLLFSFFHPLNASLPRHVLESGAWILAETELPFTLTFCRHRWCPISESSHVSPDETGSPTKPTTRALHSLSSLYFCLLLPTHGWGVKH